MFMITTLEEIQHQMDQLVQNGCRRDITIVERIQIRQELSSLRKAKKLLREQIKMTMTTQTMITESEYNHLLLNWDESVNSFKMWLQYVCGIQSNSGLFRLIDEEVRTELDLAAFIDAFDGDIDSIEDTTDLYMSRLIQ